MKPSRSSLALALAAAAAIAPAAAAAPLAIGPQIALPQLDRQGAFAGAAITARGDALLVLGGPPSVGRPEGPLVVSQRLGPRGRFGPPVRIAGAAALTEREGPIAVALDGAGNAAIAFPRSGVGVSCFIRSGWEGLWRRVDLPAGLGTEGLLLASAGHGRFDALWLDPAEPSGIATAHFQDGSWRRTSAPAPFARADPRVALGAGGRALVVWRDAAGLIWAASRSGAAAAWSAPTQLGSIEVTGVSYTTGYLQAAVGRDGSLLATWTGRLPDGIPSPALGFVPLDGWLARLRPGATAWEPTRNLGPSNFPPDATSSARGDLAVVWFDPKPPNLDDGSGAPHVLRQAPGQPWPGVSDSPSAVPGAPRLDEEGGLAGVAFVGITSAEFAGVLEAQDRRGAPVKGVSIRGTNWTGVVSAPLALLVGRPDELDPTVSWSADRLGPLGLVSPPAARAGGRVNVALNLWKPATVTVRLRGGPARAQVTKRLPAGRSVVSLRLPKRAGAYLVQAAGRETLRGKLLTQRAVVRAR